MKNVLLAISLTINVCVATTVGLIISGLLDVAYIPAPTEQQISQRENDNQRLQAALVELYK